MHPVNTNEFFRLTDAESAGATDWTPAQALAWLSGLHTAMLKDLREEGHDPKELAVKWRGDVRRLDVIWGFISEDTREAQAVAAFAEDGGDIAALTNLIEDAQDRRNEPRDAVDALAITDDAEVERLLRSKPAMRRKLLRAADEIGQDERRDSAKRDAIDLLQRVHNAINACHKLKMRPWTFCRSDGGRTPEAAKRLLHHARAGLRADGPFLSTRQIYRKIFETGAAELLALATPAEAKALRKLLNDLAKLRHPKRRARRHPR